MAHVTRRVHQRRRLIEGRNMVCPRCKKPHDILQYVPMQLIEEFAEETTTIYKCPDCRWCFAPADKLVFDLLKERTGGDDERS